MKLFGRVSALVLAALVLLAACSSDGSGTYKYKGSIVPPNLISSNDRKPAENVTGSLLSGGTYDLAKAAKDKITVINFWGAWCGPCQIETPQFESVYQRFKSKGVAFVGIDIKEASRGLPRKFVADHKITYPIVYDEDGRTAVTLGNIAALGAPYTVVLDKEHRVAGVYLQRVDQRDLETVLTKLVAEK